MNQKEYISKDRCICFGVISVIFSTGLLFCFLFILGIDVRNTNPIIILSGYVLISAILWAFLLVRKC